MIRVQRRFHARLFQVLPLLLFAALGYALWLRQRAAENRTTRATPAAQSVRVMEKVR